MSEKNRMTRNNIHDGETSGNRDGRFVVKCLRRNDGLTNEVMLTSERLGQPISCFRSIAADETTATADAPATRS